MNRVKKENLVCIECSQKIRSMFKIYSDGFKDIIECVSLWDFYWQIDNTLYLIVTYLKPSCKQLVDVYVECEYSVILIDLILFKERTYRHIIFNWDIKVNKNFGISHNKIESNKNDDILCLEIDFIENTHYILTMWRIFVLVQLEEPTIREHSI